MRPQQVRCISPTQDIRSVPKWYSVFSVVFQHRIPKCISHTYFMLWANRGSWIFQCPITLRSCVCQVLWVREFQVQTFSDGVSRCNFPLFLRVPGDPHVPVSSWFSPFHVWASQAAPARLWQSGEVTGSHGFLSSVSSSSLSAQLISSLLSFSFSCSLCIFSFSNCPTVPGFSSSTSLLSSL